MLIITREYSTFSGKQFPDLGTIILWVKKTQDNYLFVASICDDENRLSYDEEIYCSILDAYKNIIDTLSSKYFPEAHYKEYIEIEED